MHISNTHHVVLLQCAENFLKNQSPPRDNNYNNLNLHISNTDKKRVYFNSPSDSLTYSWNCWTLKWMCVPYTNKPTYVRQFYNVTRLRTDTQTCRLQFKSRACIYITFNVSTYVTEYFLNNLLLGCKCDHTTDVSSTVHHCTFLSD